MTEPENTEESERCGCGQDHSNPKMLSIDMSSGTPVVKELDPNQDADARRILERIREKLGDDDDAPVIAGMVVLNPPKQKDPFTKMAALILEKVIADKRREAVEDIWDEDFLGMFLSVMVAGFYADDDEMSYHAAKAVANVSSEELDEAFGHFFKMVERVRNNLEHAKADADLKKAAEEFAKQAKN